MCRLHRIVLLAALMALATALAGCENFDMDKLDIFHLSSKKPLPGKREPLFPNGVPGVTQGIPKEYMKSYQEQQQQQQQQDSEITPLPGQTANPPAAARPENKTAAVAPTEKPKPKPKAKKKVVKRKVKPKPKPSETAAAPANQTQSQQQTLEPWPAQGQASTAPWPSAPPPGNFTH
jgi:outer membrane biosynthesis protein TonB